MLSISGYLFLQPFLEVKRLTIVQHVTNLNNITLLGKVNSNRTILVS